MRKKIQFLTLKKQDYKLNINLLIFTRHSHIEEFMDWITNVDKFSDYTDFLEEIKVKLVAFKNPIEMHLTDGIM